MKMGTQKQHNNQDRYVNELVLENGLYWVQSGVLPDTNYSFLYLLDFIICERNSFKRIDSSTNKMGTNQFSLFSSILKPSTLKYQYAILSKPRLQIWK